MAVAEVRGTATASTIGAAGAGAGLPAHADIRQSTTQVDLGCMLSTVSDPPGKVSGAGG
jgi:hypothetical protein